MVGLLITVLTPALRYFITVSSHNLAYSSKNVLACCTSLLYTVVDIVNSFFGISESEL